jgi:hypothetical protein
VTVGVERGAGVLVADPRPRPLLGLADRDDAGSVDRRGGLLVGTGEVLFHLAFAEPDHLQAPAGHEALDVSDEPVAVAGQHDRRGDRVAPLEDELYHPAFELHAADVAGDSDAVDGVQPEGDLAGR